MKWKKTEAPGIIPIMGMILASTIFMTIVNGIIPIMGMIL